MNISPLFSLNMPYLDANSGFGQKKQFIKHCFDLLHNTHRQLKIHINNIWNTRNIKVNMNVYTLIFIYCQNQVNLRYLTENMQILQFNLTITHTSSTLNMCHMIYNPFPLFISLQISSCYIVTYCVLKFITNILVWNFFLPEVLQ